MMALSAQEFQDWLENPSAIRCMLVEVVANINGTDTTLYFSNRPYVTGPTDTPANTAYLPILKTAVSFTESLNLEGTAALNYGDISLNNYNGEYDEALQYVWVGRTIDIWIGDVKYTRDNFTKIFSGIVAEVASSDKDSINLQLRDKLQRLNIPITDTVLGPYGNAGSDNPNKEQILPLVFGEVFNIQPLLMDSATLFGPKYMVNNGPIEAIIEVRDNGVPLQPVTGYTVDLAAGTFTLIKNPAGTITCSVQGDKDTTYNNTVATIIKRIVKDFGKPSLTGTFTDDDFDLTNFSDFDTANQQKVGIYVNTKQNVLDVCAQLASGIGAQLTTTKEGLLRLLKIDIPTTGSQNITDEYIVQYSLSIVSKPEVLSSVKLGYCKNYTVEDKLLTGIPSAHKELFALEWLSKTVTDTATQTLYKHTATPDQKDTLMLSDATGDITAEATRLVNLRKVPRYIYKFTCTSKFMGLKLGDMITLTHRRFGLSNGAAAQIVSISSNWDTGYVDMEVLV